MGIFALNGKKGLVVGITVQESSTAWTTQRFHGAGAKLAVTYFFLTSMAPNQCVLAEGGLLFRPDAAATDAAPACPAGSFTPCHGSKFDLAGRVFKNPGTGEAGGDAASLFVGSYVEHCDMRQAKPKSARLVAAAAPDQVRLRLCPRHSYEWPHKIRTSP